MTATLQLDLLAPVPDPARDALLALICGDPAHEADRGAVLDAIRASVRDDGTVSSNDFRSRIPTWAHPQTVGAVVNALGRAGVLAFTGDWEMSTDTRSRNASKPVRRYHWRADR